MKIAIQGNNKKYVFKSSSGSYLIPFDNNSFLQSTFTSIENVPKLTAVEVILIKEKHQDQLEKYNAVLHEVVMTTKPTKIIIE